MAANVDAMLRAAIEAARAGKKADARALLDKVLEIEEYNEQAWLWLGAVVDTPEEQRTCLENVLVINPKNERARMGLKSLGIDPDTAVPAAGGSNAGVFTDTSFMDDLGGRSAPAFADDVDWDEDADSAPPTASSSASSASFRGEANSAGDYDSWIGTIVPGSKKSSGSAAFTGDDLPYIEDTGLFGSEEDDDSAPIAPPPSRPAAAAAPARSRAPIMDEEEDDLRSSMMNDDEDDDPFAGATDFGSSSALDEFNAAIEDDQSDMDIEDLLSGKGMEAMPAAAGMTGAGMGDDEGVREFTLIPAEITAGDRLPGESEKTPRLLVIGTALLVLLNLGALAFVVLQLT